MQKPNIVLMTGESRGVQKAVDRWKKAFVEKHGTINLEEYDTEEAGASPAFQAARMPPFLGEKRLIILKNIFKGRKKAERDSYLKALENIPDSTVLLMTEMENPLDGKEKELWAGAITLHEFQKETTVEQRETIERRLAKEGVKASPSSIQALIEAAGHDAWTLDQELEKWIIQLKSPKNAAVQPDLKPKLVEENIFKLCDDLTARRLSLALTRLKNLSRNGEEILRVLSLVARQFQLMLEVKSAGMMNQTTAQTATLLKVQPFVIQKIRAETNRFTKEELELILKGLHELDLRIKTGQVQQSSGDEEHAYLLLELLLKKQLEA